MKENADSKIPGEAWLSRSHDNRALRRSRLVSLPADVYAGRILAAKLSAIDDVAKALGVEPTEDELGVLREGYIARTRAEVLAAVTPPITPKQTRAMRLESMRARKRAERAAKERAAADTALDALAEALAGPGATLGDPDFTKAEPL